MSNRFAALENLMIVRIYIGLGEILERYEIFSQRASEVNMNGRSINHGLMNVQICRSKEAGYCSGYRIQVELIQII